MSVKLDLGRLVTILQTYGGRDKAVRTAYYALLLLIGRFKDADSPLAVKLRALAAQFSTARLVGRVFNDLPMLMTDLVHFSPQSAEKGMKDFPSYAAQSAVNVLFTIYGPIEHIAHLSDHKLLPFEPSNWWKTCLYIWTTTLVISLYKSIRAYLRTINKRLTLQKSDPNQTAELRAQEKEHLLSIVISGCDFMNAINGWPKGVLWAQTLPQYKVGAYGLIASLLGFYRLYKG